jgi:hypothetical protein
MGEFGAREGLAGEEMRARGVLELPSSALPFHCPLACCHTYDKWGVARCGKCGTDFASPPPPKGCGVWRGREMGLPVRCGKTPPACKSFQVASPLPLSSKRRRPALRRPCLATPTGPLPQRGARAPSFTNAFSKKMENHAHAMALHFLYYNFVRIHKTLKTSPAMAAGVTDRTLGGFRYGQCS